MSLGTLIKLTETKNYLQQIQSTQDIFQLRTFARKLSNFDFFLQILPLKNDELVMSEMQKKMGDHRLRFGENLPGRTP